MRLILLNLFLLCYSGLAWGQVVHICPTQTPTCVCSSILQAQQTMTATSTPGTIQLDANDSEAVTLNSNTVGTVQGSGQGVTMTNPSSIHIIQNNSSCTIPVTIQNLAFSSSSAQSVLYLASFGAGFSYVLKNLNVQNTGGAGSCFFSDQLLNSANMVSGDRCYFNCTNATGASSCIELNTASITTVGVLKFTNSIFKSVGATGAGYYDVTASSSNNIATFDHCGFYNSATGFRSKAGFAVTNCSFIGNTTDFISAGANAVTTAFHTCEFGQLTTGGTSCYYGSTASKKWCDSFNFYESPADPNLYNGTNSLNGTLDLMGNIWVAGFQCLGPIEYVLPQGRGYGGR